MSNEIREWRTQSVKHKVTFVLMLGGVSFHYNEEDDIVFNTPGSYVKSMVYHLVTYYDCSLKPVVTEYQ